MIWLCGFKDMNNKQLFSNICCWWLWKFGNCLTIQYPSVNQCAWRWLSSLSLQTQGRRLCVFVSNNIDYFGCDYMTCHFESMRGFTCSNVFASKMSWSTLEGPCAWLCAHVIFHMLMAKFTHLWGSSLSYYIVCCANNQQGLLLR
jgi:hypothetical protein